MALCHLSGVSSIKKRQLVSTGSFFRLKSRVNEHPELWNRPSRDAVTFAVNVLWKRRDWPLLVSLLFLKSSIKDGDPTPAWRKNKYGRPAGRVFILGLRWTRVSWPECHTEL